MFWSDDDEPKAVARRTDPGTSWAAAKSVRGIRPLQWWIYTTLMRFGPMTDEQIAQRWAMAPLLGVKVSPSGLRTRRDELVPLGRVRDSGRKSRMQSGRQAIVWEAVAFEGEESLGL